MVTSRLPLDLAGRLDSADPAEARVVDADGAAR